MHEDLWADSLTVEYKAEDAVKEWKLPWDKIKDSSFTFSIAEPEETKKDIVEPSKPHISDDLLEDMTDNAVLLILEAIQEINSMLSPKEKQGILRKCIREGIQAAISNPVEEKSVEEYITFSDRSWAIGTSSHATGYYTTTSETDSLGRRAVKVGLEGSF